MAPTQRQVKLNDVSYSEFFGGFMPCPHLHFNMDIINREALSREQHLNLLATPKGYRWEELSKKKEGEPPTYTNKPRIICGGRRLKKEEQSYIQNFLAELWTLFTPDLENRLKGVLMNEFGMGPTEAEEFLVEQRKINVKRSSTVGVSENTWYCPANLTHLIHEKRENARKPCQKISLGVRHYWIKEFSRNLANSINAYIMTMLSVKRTKRTQCFSEVILKLLGSIIGEELTLDSPKTKLQNLCVFVADRLGVLLGGITCTADAQLMEMLRRLEEKEEEVPPEEEAEELEIVEEEEEEEEEEIEIIQEEAVVEEEEVEVVEEIVEEEIEEKVPVVEEEEEEVPIEEVVEEVVEVPEPEIEEVEIKEPEVEEPPVVEEPVVKKVEPPPPVKEVTPVPSVVEEIKEPEPVKKVEPPPEVKPDITTPIISLIETAKPKDTPREIDLSSIVKDRLDDKIKPTDEVTKKAVDDVSKQVGAFVDKVVKEVEADYGITKPPPEPKARPAFRIRRDYTTPGYSVKAIPSDIVLQKVIEGRSQPAKAMAGAITKRPGKTTNLKKPKGMAEWASWATDVASVAENWAGWIDRTCTQLAETADKHKEGTLMTKEDWAKMKKETANKVIEWRKNKLLLKEAAKMWEKKFKK